MIKVIEKDYLYYFLVIILGIYPPLVGLYYDGTGGIIKFFEADTFYYLNILKRSLEINYYSYDGYYPTNGFHPLWQYFLTFSAKIFNLKDLDDFIYLVFFSSITFSTIGSLFIFNAIKKITNNSLLSLIATIPNLYYLLFGSIHLSFNAYWSYINGMESSISYLFFGTFLYLIINKEYFKELNTLSLWQFISLGIVLSFLILSRLDDIFIMISIAIFMFVYLDYKNYLKASFVGLIPFLVILLYLLYNHDYSNYYMPSSGGSKFSFNYHNIISSIRLIFPPDFKLQQLNMYSVWSELEQRAAQMIMPLLIVSVFIYNVRKKVLSYNEKILLLLSSYTTIKALFNLFFVPIWHQGHWYYTISITISSILIAYMIKDIKFNTKISIVLVSVYIMITANSYMSYKKFIHHNNTYSTFYSQKNSIQNMLDKKNVKGIIELDDGIIGFSLKNKTLSFLGFALDYEALESKKNGNLFNLAYNRGYNAFASSNYLFDATDDVLHDNLKLNEYIKSNVFLRNENLVNFEFSLLFKDEKSGAIFIKFNKRN
ncbi:MAG: hypothetical protein VX835_04645 [Pseudomonadota bacterium]|nr:hypothetical protein [Pseudomonadota bacterium]